MKLLKKMWFKIYFDTKTKAPIGINTQNHCMNCGILKRIGATIHEAPPAVQGLIISDMDRSLPPIIGKPSHVIETHAEVLIYETKK